MSQPGSSPDVWTVGRLLKWTADYFAQRGFDTPRLDAEILLAKAMGCERIGLYTRFMEVASDEVRAIYRDLVKRRAVGTPTAHLIGEKEFYSLTFKVTPDTLIPRPETEHLVIETLDIIKKREARSEKREARSERREARSEKRETRSENMECVDLSTLYSHRLACESETIESKETSQSYDLQASLQGQSDDKSSHSITDSPDTVTDKETGETYIKFVPRTNPLKDVKLNILDIGTGSGILPITLATQLPSCRFVAVDISQPALAVAKENAKIHKVDSQIEFRCSDLFSSISSEEKFDIIVSNPPYIGEEERPTLDASVRDFEPAQALFSGPKGTDLIAKMIEQAPDKLNPDGWLLFEMSPIIHDSVLSILSNQTKLSYIRTVNDLSNLPRVVICRKNDKTPTVLQNDFR